MMANRRKRNIFQSVTSHKLDWREIPQDSFTMADREKALEEFRAKLPGNATLWDRLEETRARLPWLRSLVDSLQSQIIVKGELSDKQRSLATKLYLDACMTSDDKIEEQQEARKLGYRLLELNLGNAFTFVNDVMFKSSSRPLSFGQMRAMRNIAKRQVNKLAQVPKLTDETFDGWFQIVPKEDVDSD